MKRTQVLMEGSFRTRKSQSPKALIDCFIWLLLLRYFLTRHKSSNKKKKRKEQCSLLHAISFNRFPLLLHLFPLFLFFFFVDTMYAAFSSSSYHILWWIVGHLISPFFFYCTAYLTLSFFFFPLRKRKCHGNMRSRSVGVSLAPRRLLYYA